MQQMGLILTRVPQKVAVPLRTYNTLLFQGFSTFFGLQSLKNLPVMVQTAVELIKLPNN